MREAILCKATPGDHWAGQRLLGILWFGWSRRALLMAGPEDHRAGHRLLCMQLDLSRFGLPMAIGK